MNVPSALIVAALAVSGVSPLQAQGAASAPAATHVAAHAAGERCETAVADTVRTLRGRAAQELQFVPGRRLLTALSGDETSVRGEGRYRGTDGRSVAFGYSCVFDETTGATSGVVLRDARGAEAANSVAWQPDLSAVSPEACESAVAAELKRRHPRVGRIGLDAGSRRLSPAPIDGRVLLEGSGALERAPGMALRPLRYSCEIDTRSARVLRVSTQD